MDRILSESPWMTIINKSELEVEINIEGIIGGGFWDEDEEGAINTKEAMRNELKAIAKTEASKIIVNINSYGGDVNHGISIYDMLAQNKAEVITRVSGFTASIATVIAMAGDRREMSSNALFLIHKPSLMMLGGFNENDLEKRIEQLKIVDKRIRDIYIKRGAVNWMVDRLMEEDGGRGKWLDADEAKAELFIDHVYEPMKMAACVEEPELLKSLGIAGIPDNYKNQIKMANENSVLKGMFDELKDFIAGILKPEAPKGEEGEEVTGEVKETKDDQKIMVAPAEIEAKMEAMKEAIEAVEINEQAVAEVETLTAEKVELEKSINDLKAENKTQKEKMIELEGKLTKLNGGSTKVDGPEGLEDPADEGKTVEQKALTRDLQAMRGELTEVHN